MEKKSNYKPSKWFYVYAAILAIPLFLKPAAFPILALLLFFGYAADYALSGSSAPVIERTPEQEKKLKEQKEKMAKDVARYKIVKVQILGQGPSTYVTKGGAVSAVTRGVVGYLINPVVGIIGAATPRRKTVEKQKLRFLVEYADGHKTVEEVNVDSKRYEQLIQYL